MSTRNPPSPTENHSLIDSWKKSIMPELEPIVTKLDELIIKNIPQLQYAVKWGKAYYGTTKLGWIIELVAYDISVNIVFHSGAKFNQPPILGTGDSSRYIKLRSLSDANDSNILDWIKQSGSYIGWR